MSVLIINGPNLNKLGERDNKIYGAKTLENINSEILAYAQQLKLEVEFFQSNIEGEIVTRIQDTKARAIIINAGAFTHYSLAIADALKDYKGKKIEVHLSNILAREKERQVSVLSSVCDGIISGFLEKSYLLALEYIRLCGDYKSPLQ